MDEGSLRVWGRTITKSICLAGWVGSFLTSFDCFFQCSPDYVLALGSEVVQRKLTLHSLEESPDTIIFRYGSEEIF